VIPGPFDRESVMLYRFPEIFYRNPPSQCAPIGPGISLSEGDRRGLQLLYPQTAPEMSGLTDRRTQLLEIVEAPGATEFEAVGNGSPFAEQACRTLRFVLSKAE
jgi:hypothetical protein